MPHRHTVAEIDLNALRHNVNEVKSRAGTAAIMAVVKANAYGHGAVFCARALEGAGIGELAVATVEEGVELRDKGIRGVIYVLDGLLTATPQSFIDYRLRPMLGHTDDISRWGDFLRERSREQNAHLKLDTGMGRMGILPAQIETVCDLLRRYSEMKLTGVFTHFACADEEDPSVTDRQIVLFDRLRKILEEKGFAYPFHYANSATIIDRPRSGEAWVRPGIMLYGAYPHPRHEALISLKPVMTLKTKIMAVKTQPSGSPLGYGGTHTLKRDSRIAVLPVGYADGYPRLLSNRGHVLVHGQKAPVVGRISMDLTLIDVTDVPEAVAGDDVVLFGKQGEAVLKVEEVAGWAETISYEILCGISARVPRVYLGM